MKGMLVTFKWKLVKFFIVRLLLQAKEYVIPFVMASVITWI